MGSFAVFRGSTTASMQVLASFCKTPLLIAMTTVISFPSLYVLMTLMGSKLYFGAVLKMFVAALSVFLAVLASLGPITAFFSASTESYIFVVLMNVLLFAISGFLSLIFLMQFTWRVYRSEVDTEALQQQKQCPIPQSDEETAESTSTRGRYDAPRHARRGVSWLMELLARFFLVGRNSIVVGFWSLVFACVCAQSSWLLRPFIGDPRAEFAWFRPRASNVFEALSALIQSLF
jgi:hypothetical protein